MRRAPARGLFALEPVRAAQELVGRVLADPQLRRAAKGDGHHVLVMPGLGGSDLSTRILRAFLRRLGYYVHAWRLGRNLGPTDHIIDGLGERFGSLSTDGRITLIGHSMGGIYARELARRAPHRVRQVVTLGSPVTWRRGARSNVSGVYRTLSPLHSERVRDAPADYGPSLPAVPLTAIFTKRDGVVPWRSCVFTPDDRHECIEVRGSHTGLIHNAAALLVIADRLAQEDGEWKPFVERAGVGARVWTPD
jgi:pimeloyl-ACP methyl ester carboxylesterase